MLQVDIENVRGRLGHRNLHVTRAELNDLRELGLIQYIPDNRAQWWSVRVVA